MRQVRIRRGRPALVTLLLVAGLLTVPRVAEAQPTNDNFVDRVMVESIPFSDSGDTTDATSEVDEPSPCAGIDATIWYEFTPAEDSGLLAATLGSDYDTALAVYTGSSLSDLELIDCDDDGGFDLDSRVTFPAEEGVTYFFQLGGFAGEWGNFEFDLVEDQTEPGTGSISGTLTEASSSDPIEGVCVNIYDAFGDYLDTVWSEVDGSYSFESLNSGNYIVQFYGPCAGNFLEEWWNDQPNIESADAVAVVDATSTTGIDAALAAGGSISGTVTDPSGNPIEGVCVNASDPGSAEGGSDETAADGTYTIEGIPNGSYEVGFFGECAGNYLNEWWDDQPNGESADPVVVTAPNETSGIDAELSLGGLITGTVTDDDGDPVENICVDVYNSLGHFESFENFSGWSGFDETDADGSYEVGSLQSGTYKVLFYENCVDDHDIQGWFDGRTNFETADVVVVEAGEVTAGIDFEIEGGGGGSSGGGGGGGGSRRTPSPTPTPTPSPSDVGSSPAPTPAPSLSAAPTQIPVESVVTIRLASGKKVRGSVTSSMARCNRNRSITIKRSDPGPDSLIGSTRTDRRGKYELQRSKLNGRYYAVAQRKVFTRDDGSTVRCMKKRSNSIRI